MRKYDDVERLGKDEVEGILQGTVYVFEKIDGANCNLYWDNEKGLTICSRNNIIYTDKEGRVNQGLKGVNEYVNSKLNIKEMVKTHPEKIFYGEYLCKHTIKYPIEHTNKIWFFDIYDNETHKYLTWEVAKDIFEKYGVLRSPTLAILENPSAQDTYAYLDINIFKGEPRQEGIVLKNYNFINKYGRQQWAKIVNTQYKEVKRIKKPKTEIEIKIAESFITEARVHKILKKMYTESSIISEKNTGEVMNRVYNDLIQEELWDILKKEKEPTIDFRQLKHLVNDKVREIFFSSLNVKTEL